MTREGDGDQMLLQNAKVANFSYFSQFNKSLFCHNKIITTTCYAKLPLFVYFRSFLITISKIQIEKSVHGVLGIQTRGQRNIGADETAALWRLQ